MSSRAYQRELKNPEYQRNRKLAFQRDGFRCRMCGKYDPTHTGKGLTADHVVPFRLSRSHAVENLATLCRPCHGSKDGGRRYRHKEQLR